MVPEWAPSIHPLVVHFPVALLVVACGVDVLAFFIKERPGLLPAANGLYALGAVAAVAARSGTCGLNISGEKTMATMFTWKQKWKYHPLKYMQSEISLTNRVTYLGITLD